MKTNTARPTHNNTLRSLLKYPLVLALLFSSVLIGTAAEIEFNDEGQVAVDHIRFRVAVMDNKEKFHMLNGPTFKQLDFKQKAGTSETSYELKMPGYPKGILTQKTREISDEKLEYQAQLKFESSTILKGIILTPVTMSVKRFGGSALIIDGQSIPLPTDKPNGYGADLYDGNASSLEIPLHSGTLVISGDFSVRLMDQRKGNPNYSLRIRFNPSFGKVTTSNLKLTFEVRDE